PRQTRPVTDVDLAQLAQRRHVEPPTGSDDRGSLPRPGEVARVDGVDRGAGEVGRELLGLHPPGCAERRVAVTLPAAGAVPLGLAMAREENRRHSGYASAPVDLGLQGSV